jgi:hypothetical protein
MIIEYLDLKALRRGLKESSKRKLRKRSRGRCIVCGSSEGLEIAHILPVRFLKQAAGFALMKEGLDRKFDEDFADIATYVNDEKNLAVLCNRCHRKFDGRDGKGKSRQKKIEGFLT